MRVITLRKPRSEGEEGYQEEKRALTLWRDLIKIEEYLQILVAIGAIIHYTLTIASDADIHYKLRKASAAFGALRECFFSSRYVN